MHCARSRRVMTLLLRATCKGLMEFGSIIIISSSIIISIASASHQHHHIPLLTNKVTGDTRKNTPFLTIIMGPAISWSWDFYSTFPIFPLPRAFPGPFARSPSWVPTTASPRRWTPAAGRVPPRAASQRRPPSGTNSGRSRGWEMGISPKNYLYLVVSNMAFIFHNIYIYNYIYILFIYIYIYIIYIYIYYLYIYKYYYIYMIILPID